MKTPDYYLPIMPYMLVSDAESFASFLKNSFDAEERLTVLRENNTIRHAEYSIGKATIMFAEADSEFPQFPCQLFLLNNTVDALYKKSLENGATSLQEPLERDYGRSAGVQDPFGNIWWITAEMND